MILPSKILYLWSKEFHTVDHGAFVLLINVNAAQIDIIYLNIVKSGDFKDMACK